MSFPARDLPARQRTLENVIDWSFRLLSDDQRALFCRLGVFSGWFDEQAVAAVCLERNSLEQSAVSTLLTELADHSLLERSNLLNRPYWRLLGIIREYARLRLPVEQAYPLAYPRAYYYLEYLKRFPTNLSETESANLFQLILPDLHAALAWTADHQQAELAVQLTFHLDNFWHKLGYLREGLDLARRVLAISEMLDPVMRTRLVEIASDLAWQQHDFDSALKTSEEVVQLARAAGLDQYPDFLNRLGRIYIEQGLYAQAARVLNECLMLAHRAPSLMNPGIPLAQLGDIALVEGRWEEGRTILEEMVNLSHP